MEITNPTLPVNISYTDKIDLVQKVLKIYSAIVAPLTRTDIDMLTLCILEDMNIKKFSETVVRSGVGNIKTVNQVSTQMTRLRQKGFIYKDPIKLHDHLETKLEKIRELVLNNTSVTLKLNFLKR